MRTFKLVGILQKKINLKKCHGFTRHAKHEKEKPAFRRKNRKEARVSSYILFQIKAVRLI